MFDRLLWNMRPLILLRPPSSPNLIKSLFMFTCNAVVYIVGAPVSQADNKRFSLVRTWKRRYDIRQYCKKRGLTAVRYFADQCRGATMGRPGFSRLLGFVQESTVNIDIILVYSWQDLFSSASELTQIYAEMDRLNIYPEAVKNICVSSAGKAQTGNV